MNLISTANNLQFDQNGHLGFIIFEAIQNIGVDEQRDIAAHISSMFPDNNDVSDFKPFKQHLHTSFMRKLFGMKDRNGTLISITHPGRVDQYNMNCERSNLWNATFKFMDILEDEFQKRDKKFGLILLHEALGHRYGDLFVLRDDKGKYSELMLSHYKKSFRLAKSIKCSKQMYVLWYWAGCYYYKSGNLDTAKNFLVRFHKSYLKNKKRARVVPDEKIKISFRLLKKIMLPDEYKIYSRYMKSRV